MKRRSYAAMGVSLVALLAAAPSPAFGAPPVGQCPDSFVVATREEAVEMGQLALFEAVNNNGDDIICFRPFNKKPGGALVDNTARPQA